MRIWDQPFHLISISVTKKKIAGYAHITACNVSRICTYHSMQCCAMQFTTTTISRQLKTDPYSTHFYHNSCPEAVICMLVWNLDWGRMRVREVVLVQLFLSLASAIVNVFELMMTDYLKQTLCCQNMGGKNLNLIVPSKSSHHSHFPKERKR